MQYRIPSVLKQIQDLVEAKLGVTFNHCMANLYEDGKVYIGNHRDNKENRVIASLSLGAPRTFVMTYDKPKGKVALAGTVKGVEGDSEERQKWLLANGSLVVMQGTTQQYWKHEIPKYVLHSLPIALALTIDEKGTENQGRSHQFDVSTARLLVIISHSIQHLARTRIHVDILFPRCQYYHNRLFSGFIGLVLLRPAPTLILQPSSRQNQRQRNSAPISQRDVSISPMLFTHFSSSFPHLLTLLKIV